MEVWFWFKLVTEGQLEESADKVKLNENADVADFRKAVKGERANDCAKVDAARLGVFENEASWRNNNNSMKASRKLCEEKADLNISRLGQDDEESALIVVVPPTLTILKEKHMAYKRMSAEASCRKFLDAVANSLVADYDFKRSFGLHAAISDVFRAIDKSKWKPRNSAVTISLPDFFEQEDWGLLRRLNSKVNLRIHDGALHKNSMNKSYIVLLDSECNSENRERVSKIALKAQLIAEENALQVKDETAYSSASSSAKSSPD